jgi:hypothetical protein
VPRRLVIGTVALAGLGLFGTGVHGLVQVDGKLADAVGRPAVQDVKDELGSRGDCPRHERRRYELRSERQL